MAFAANSLLARAAIDPGGDGPAIGPVAFTALRLAAGALVLWPWLRGARARAVAPARGTVASHTRVHLSVLLSVALVAYALPFALAYVELGAATGALVLFGAVQITMLSAGRRSGERLGSRGTVGLVAAAAGMAFLLLPGASAPTPWAAAAMLIAGVAWGAYSLVGRGVADPLRSTARAFVWSLPAAALLAAWPGAWQGVTATGVALALASGGLTSGLGYLVWYLVLPSLTRSAASIVQLLVPVVAAFGAVALLGEAIDARLVTASLLVLGGVGLVVLRRR